MDPHRAGPSIQDVLMRQDVHRSSLLWDASLAGEEVPGVLTCRHRDKVPNMKVMSVFFGRWKGVKITTEHPMHVLRAYRLSFTSLRPNQVSCVTSRNLWHVESQLRIMEKCEPGSEIYNDCINALRAVEELGRLTLDDARTAGNTSELATPGWRQTPVPTSGRRQTPVPTSGRCYTPVHDHTMEEASQTADEMCLDIGYDIGSMAHDNRGPSHTFAHGDTSRSPSMRSDDTCPPTSPTISPLPTARMSPPVTTGTASADVHELFLFFFQNAIRNSSLQLASLEQEKADVNVLKLAEDQKVYRLVILYNWFLTQRQKEELHKRIIQLQKQLDAKQALELEIERLRGSLNVMKHMGDDADVEILEKVDTILKQLRDKEGELEDLEALNQTLILTERKSNDELQEARKELVNVSVLPLQ
ncbi:protein involved in de novo 2 [Quercus suber]|uniref:Protein involved in de novo 2 n=1 Tax=Quercus suber TaxID=58331 RepID=A0AAW0JJS0_QUESU